MTKKVDEWSIGDYLEHFVKEAEKSDDKRFLLAFEGLAEQLELLDSEFIKETRGCSAGLAPLFDRLHSIAGRLGYCERPRGFESECDDLYAEVEKAVEEARAFRVSCTI